MNTETKTPETRMITTVDAAQDKSAARTLLAALGGKLFRDQFGDHAEARLRKEAYFLHQLLRASQASRGKLHFCTPQSLVTCVEQVVLRGLTLDPTRKLVYLIPYGNTATISISYRGEIDILTRAGIITRATCRVVRKKDTFAWHEVNGVPSVRFAPDLEGTSPLIGAFCLYHLTDGGIAGRFAPKVEIEKRRAASRGGGIWKAWEPEMYMKTAVRMARHGLPDERGVIAEIDDIDNQHFQLEEVEPDAERIAEAQEKLGDVETHAELAALYNSLETAEQKAMKEAFTLRKKQISA